VAKRAIVLLAEGFEEVEAITPVDYLRRAGIEVTTAAIGPGMNVKGARGISVSADTTLNDIIQQQKAAAAFWDAVILPGGMPGADKLAASKEAGGLLRDMAAAGKWVCAICASPALVLAPLGLLSGKKFTCYPGMEAQVHGGFHSGGQVVIDEGKNGNIITSRGAGTAGAFALAIISRLQGPGEAGKVANAVLLN
jgi:4-methyl-5(b-hydroxyethyl)-thiazole monophosphate biosynthesis